MNYFIARYIVQTIEKKCHGNACSAALLNEMVIIKEIVFSWITLPSNGNLNQNKIAGEVIIIQE
jgi:hypothetical protein